MTKSSDDTWEEGFQRCVDFHGHACPGLAMGYVAATAAMAWLGERRAPDEEIVAVVETDACGADAIQVVTGCTFGKGNFIFKDYGKTAFSLLSRSSGKGVRLCAKPEGSSLAPEHRALFDKVSSNTADDGELKRFWDLHRQRTIEVLNKGAEKIFDIHEVTTPTPTKARVHESLTCSRCGESTMATRIVKTEEGPVCTSCIESKGQAERTV
jgi:formylmethanofuran dehydrogenase subunit E